MDKIPFLMDFVIIFENPLPICLLEKKMVLKAKK